MRSGIVAMATMCAFSSGIIAAELPKSGSLDRPPAANIEEQPIAILTQGRYFSYTITIEEMETADDMTAYVIEAIEFHDGMSVGDLLDSTTTRCLGFGRYSEATDAIHETGRSTHTDRDGDKFFTEYVIDLTSPNEATLIGGTGKYEGIQGTIRFTADAPLPVISESKEMFTGQYEGEYWTPP